ncbi:translation initiation factor IF-2 [Chloroflexota bacterium]
MAVAGEQNNITKPEADNSQTAPKAPSVEIPRAISIKQLSETLSISAIDIIKRVMRSGLMANINQVVDYEIASAIAKDLGYETHLQPLTARKSATVISEIKRKQLESKKADGLQVRPPIVTIMGHVDHGKTRILDAIRQSNIIDGEAGGITQHIGAYQVEVNGQKITFLDTPGHEAFTAIRARGAQVTDITILVVAADDGVMPQTLEAIDHARAAGVPIMVAINKIDIPEANLDVVKQQLADAGLVIEEWGGDTVCVLTSAKENTGISELLENLLLIAEIEELKANPAQPAAGVTIEANMDKTKGPLATILVLDGTLNLGDTVVIGTTWGRIKAMFSDTGKRVKKAEPATPVVILGLNNVPQVGDPLISAGNEHEAQDLIQKRQQEIEQGVTEKSVNLNNLFDQLNTGQVKELNVVLKADVQGSIEAIRMSLEQLGTEETKVRVIRSGSGNITESDVMLAIASKGIIIGFNVDAELGARRLAEIESVSIRNYTIIYNLVDDISKALKGMLEPTYIEIIDGRAEIRAVFPAGKSAKAAGIYITEGRATRGTATRIKRGGEVIAESTIGSLKRFKDNVREVTSGYECGAVIDGYNEFQVGDTLEFLRKEKAN